MLNPFKEINWQPEDKEIRQFGSVILTGCCIAALLISWLTSGASIFVPYFLLLASFIIFILSMMIPKAALPFYLVWFFFAACIGIVISNLLIMAFFFLIFTPFSYILRTVTGRDPLAIKKDSSRSSYWIEKTGEKDLKRYLKQY